MWSHTTQPAQGFCYGEHKLCIALSRRSLARWRHSMILLQRLLAVFQAT